MLQTIYAPEPPAWIMGGALLGLSRLDVLPWRGAQAVAKQPLWRHPALTRLGQRPGGMAIMRNLVLGRARK